MALRALLLGAFALSSTAMISCAGSSPSPDDPQSSAGTNGNDPNAVQLVIPPILSDAGSPLAIAAMTPVMEPADTRGALSVTNRDPRIAKRRPRSRALVLTEVQGLERLLDATKPTAMDRPQIRRRIAETYNELAMTSSGAEAERARAKSIEHYAAIPSESPSFAQVDEVFYYMGLAYELNGDKMNARKNYYELIKRTPQSKLVPLAYFAFGEMFFMESASDPSKTDLAKQAFMEVLKYPAGDNGVYPDTLLRMGQIAMRMKDDAKANEMFSRLQSTFPDSEAASQIAAARIR